MRLEIVLVIRTSEPTPTRGVDVDTIDCIVRVYFGGQGGRQLTRCSSSPSESRSLTDAHEEVLFFQYG